MPHLENPLARMENMQSDCKEWEKKDAAATSYFTNSQERTWGIYLGNIIRHFLSHSLQ